MNGTDLLAEFRATRAELAFSELVRRFTNLVYSIAKRRVRDVTLAQEITQIVFIRLANAPPRLDKEAQLLAWLHRTTVHVSIDLWRSETRRRAREQLAVAMQNDRIEEIAWSEMTPVLDEALDRLDEADRQTILLRFFHQKSMADLGRDFGISEDAAKMLYGPGRLDVAGYADSEGYTSDDPVRAKEPIEGSSTPAKTGKLARTSVP